MILDIIIGIVVIFAMVQGFRNGFVRTFLHTAGWLLALVLAFAWSDRVKAFLIEKTDFYDAIYENILGKFSGELSGVQASFQNLPPVIGKSLNSATEDISADLAGNAAMLLFTLLSFLTVIFAIKLLLWLLVSLLSKKDNDGITGVVDGMLGLVFGLAKGIILVFVLLALMVPVAGLASPEHVLMINEALESSKFAGDLYDNNLILLVISDLFA